MSLSDDLKSRIVISKPPSQAAEISKRILTIRGQGVMLDAGLAELYGVPTYQAWENPKVANPTLKQLSKLAGAVGKKLIIEMT